MNTYQTHSCGYRLTFQGPATTEEYDVKAGKPGTALEHACLHRIHTRTLPEWQERFAALTELPEFKLARDAKGRPDPQSLARLLNHFILTKLGMPLTKGM